VVYEAFDGTSCTAWTVKHASKEWRGIISGCNGFALPSSPIILSFKVAGDNDPQTAILGAKSIYSAS
jgi:hypothetical protein